MLVTSLFYIAPLIVPSILLPELANLRAAVIAGSPIPVAISNTFWPPLISASSTSLSLTFCAATSTVCHHSFQPSATLSRL